MTKYVKGPIKPGPMKEMTLEEILESYTDEQIGVCVQWLVAFRDVAAPDVAAAMDHTLGEIARWERK